MSARFDFDSELETVGTAFPSRGSGAAGYIRLGFLFEVYLSEQLPRSGRWMRSERA
jgi:hypothetical protein